MIFCRNKCVFVYYIHLSCNKTALPVRLQVREKQNLSPSLRVLKQNQTFLAGGEYRKTESEKESKERKKKNTMKCIEQWQHDEVHVLNLFVTRLDS
jgi:hypothetical protein